MNKVIDKSVFFTNSCFRSAAIRIFVGHNFEILSNPDEAEYLCFLGGSDISPSLYGEDDTHSWTEPSLDEYELAIFGKYPEKKKLGICRGGQLLNVVSGGGMWQDCDGHSGDHSMKDHLSGRMVKTTSLHHQMMRPSSDALILATANRSSYVQGGGSKLVKAKQYYDDIEACWYPHTKSLCYQGHPELGYHEYFFELIAKTVDTLEL